MTIASLAMYPFDRLRPSWEQLWDAVRSRLPFEAPALDWQIPSDAAMRRDDLLLGQTCGWPLVDALSARVRVVGTFDTDVGGSVDGTYRSVLISAADQPLAELFGRDDLVVAVNSLDSLSGWISLQAAARAHGVAVENVEVTTAHARSVEAVRAGRCHLASIDSVSWSFLDQTGLFVVGHGPRVPSLPLVMATAMPEPLVTELRVALAAAVADPATAAVRAVLRIRGFLVRELTDYQGVAQLLEVG
ncbi:MAG: PhnD/SsuA/transferrin family substrate-binding protein [Ilumatobacteraceae bacterium]